MVNFTLFENISDLPLVSDPDRAAIGVENWLSASRDHGLTAAAKALADDAVGQSFLRAIFGNSPFLSHGVLRDPGFMLRLAEDGYGKGVICKSCERSACSQLCRRQHRFEALCCLLRRGVGSPS